MEVVLLWLDDLDDALFSVALVWERLRRVVLAIGLASSFALAASELSAIATHWAPAFSYVAASSVAAWIAGAVLRAFYYREPRGSLTA
jgi:CHASE2 domain-containing sensor protein